MARTVHKKTLTIHKTGSSSGHVNYTDTLRLDAGAINGISDVVDVTSYSAILMEVSDDGVTWQSCLTNAASTPLFDDTVDAGSINVPVARTSGFVYVRFYLTLAGQPGDVVFGTAPTLDVWYTQGRAPNPPQQRRFSVDTTTGYSDAIPLDGKRLVSLATTLNDFGSYGVVNIEVAFTAGAWYTVSDPGTGNPVTFDDGSMVGTLFTPKREVSGFNYARILFNDMELESSTPGVTVRWQ